jgi:cyclase
MGDTIMKKEEAIPTWEPGVKQLAPNVYACIQAKATWFWNNAGFIVGSEYVIVIDSLATVGLTGEFLKEIRKITDKPVRYLINTHHHGDHIWGNHVFRGATVISHSYCRREATETPMMDPDLLNAVFTDFDFRGIAVTPADITFDSQLTLHMDGREIRLIHLGPGHTAGDIIVHLPGDGIVFASDLIFLHSTPLGMEGSFAGWLNNLHSLANMDVHTYVPGHGPVCDMEGLNLCRDYLLLVQTEARKRFDKGMTPDEAARGFPLGQFRQWPDRERILANVERLWREFRGEDPTTSRLDTIDVFSRMATMAAAGEP